jgi:hypothetical protein
MSDTPSAPSPTTKSARHTLPDEDFAALAAGRPSAATIELLRRSQVSKHLLLLHEIDKADSGSGYAELAAAERQDPAALRRALADPLLGAWAAARLTALRREQREAGRIEPDPASAPVDGHRLAELAAAVSGRVEISGRRLVASHDGLGIDVRLEDADPVRARLGLRPAARLSEGEFARWRELFAGAWRVLVSRHRAGAETLAAVLAVIVPVEPDPAARGISATSADAFGAVAMSVPADATAFAVALLHETQHSLLNAVNYLFDLDREPGALGYSPWRDDPRPASGILQGAYAYLAVTRFWRAELTDSSKDGLAAFEFVRWRGAVATAARELIDRGTLTAAGERFVGALLAEVRPWLTEDAPAEVVRLAEGANADHRLRWRLRNLVVDPDDVEALAGAWRQGLAAPGGSIRSRLVPAPRRALESSARLDLAHARVAGRGLTYPDLRPGGRASAADVAYLGGDGGTAADAYKKILGTDDAWAGLALVCGWERVEVLAAVHAALGGEAEVTELAGWIFG